MQQDEWMMLVQALDRLRRAWKNVQVDVPVNKSQLFTMLVLCNKGSRMDAGGKTDPYDAMTLSGLAREMGQSTPAVCQRVTQLEELGYVERIPDTADKRTVWVKLTTAGLQLVETGRADLGRKLKKVAEALGSDVMERLITDFNCLSETIIQSFAR